MGTVTAQPEEARTSDSALSLSLERRANKRLRARSTVVIEIRKGTMGLGPNLALHLLDISVDGAGVLMEGKLQVNDEVEILMSGHGVRSKVKRIARVQWVTKLEPDNFV